MFSLEADSHALLMLWNILSATSKLPPCEERGREELPEEEPRCAALPASPPFVHLSLRRGFCR